jgi:malonate-semialdehyde dehydrogenase (acetylating)/methylmalonate-semialdehyde dehydrogenase
VDSISDKSEIVVNPAAGETIAEIPISTKEDVDRAVQVGSDLRVWPDWEKIWTYAL